MIVLIALTEKTVVMAQTLNPNPISGRQSIFARVGAPTEVKPVVEIVGIYSTLDLAATARANHYSTHPGAKYVQKVASLDDSNLHAPQPATCIRCGTQIATGSYCPAHQAQFIEECKLADPLLGAPDDVPLVRTNIGQGPQHLVLANP